MAQGNWPFGVTHRWAQLAPSAGGRAEWLVATLYARALKMACRPTQLGPSHPRGPHPNRRLSAAGKSVPNLERSQQVRRHQAGLPHGSVPPGWHETAQLRL